jgi:hypothetical protein
MQKIAIAFIILICLGCDSQKKKFDTLDLMAHGVPLTIDAPEGVEVNVDDLGIFRDITVKNTEGYSIQILESEPKALDVTSITQEIKAEIEGSQFFSKIILEKENGFIYEKKIDESYINYDFRHISIRGDKQYVFQAGLTEQYTQSQVEDMFDSVQ